MTKQELILYDDMTPLSQKRKRIKSPNHYFNQWFAKEFNKALFDALMGDAIDIVEWKVNMNEKVFKGIKRGVMVMKNDKAWGVKYKDGQCTAYGWIDPIGAPIHDPRFCTNPLSVTYQNSPYAKELVTAKLVHVERETILRILPNDDQK